MKKKILSLTLLLAVVLSFALPTFAAYDFDEIRIIDSADFLTEADYATVYTKLCDASRKYGVELFIYTEKVGYEVSVDDVERFADKYYKELFGGVTGKESVILYVVDDTMESDCAYIYTSGAKCRAAISDSAVQHIIENALRDGGKSDRFVLYADECVRLFDLYQATGKEYKEPFGWFGAIVISLGIGFVIALVVVLIMKGKLKTVRFRNDAADYTVPDSMNVTDERELYLYSTVVATPKPKNNDSDSSSGSSSSHGGGGGRI